MKDDQLIEELLADGPEGPRFQGACIRLYKQFRGLKKKAGQSYPGLAEEHLTDAFHEALNALVQGIIQREYDGRKAKLSTLFFSIFSNKCIDQLRALTSHKRKWSQSWASLTPDLPIASQAFLEELMDKEVVEGLASLMDQLGSPCKELILAMDYWGYSPEEAARVYRYKDGKSASQAKYRCLQQLRKRLSSYAPNAQRS